MNEKVKKVFNLLGVEPNERFKVDGYKGSFAIDENLVCKIPYNNDFNYYKWLADILINPEIIIKLPKEPKKKKLRDLTPEEWDKWQKKNCGDCSKCIFANVTCFGSFVKESWIHHKDVYSEKFLNQEIEVEENE